MSERLPTSNSRLDRRTLLTALGVAGFSFAPLPWWPERSRAEAFSWSNPFERFTKKHRQKTLKALMNAILPSGGAGSPGALEAGSEDAIKVEHYLAAAVNLGALAKVPDALEGHGSEIDAVVREVVTDDLDTIVFFSFDPTKTFIELSFDEQTKVVEQAFSSLLKPLYEFVRAACLIAFLGAPENDKGVVFIGMNAYVDWKDGLNNTGYSDYSMNEVPSVGALTVWEQTTNGDIP